MDELKPEDVMRTLAWYEVVGKNIGSVTVPYDELQAIANLLRENNAEIEKLTVNMNAYGLTAKNLAEENERLTNICQSYALQYGTARDKEYFLNKARAEAITEFAEKVVGRFNTCDKAMYPQTAIHDVVTRIAKEMKAENES